MAEFRWAAYPYGLGLDEHDEVCCEGTPANVQADFETVRRANKTDKLLIDNDTRQWQTDERGVEYCVCTNDTDELHALAEQIRTARANKLAARDARLAALREEAASTGKPVLIQSRVYPDDEEDEGWIVHDTLMQPSGEIEERTRRTY
ncbi:MAG: hypothetical protein ACXQS4_05130 [Methermicoccaceae archaeon]